jgi:hypothetical protein
MKNIKQEELLTIIIEDLRVLQEENPYKTEFYDIVKGNLQAYYNILISTGYSENKIFQLYKSLGLGYVKI